MYSVITTNRFDKDLKKAIKRGKDLSKIQSIMTMLASGISLPLRDRDHIIIGNYNMRHECHIESDCLLIYKLDIDNQDIIFERTGTHSDLF